MSNKPHAKSADFRREYLGFVFQQHHTGHEIMEVFRELNAQGQTIFMVTHNPESAAVAHRIVNIMDGRMFDESEKE